MNQESIYTSTGIKLLHHPEVLRSIKKNGFVRPISLQVAPTSRCNLNCSFCSNANRENHEDLDFERIYKLLRELSWIGLKTVEWTGGGEPTLYKHLAEAVKVAQGLDLQQGLITNGLLLNKLNSDVLASLKWIRISMNCLDYVKEIKIPAFGGTLGFSYVVNEDSKPETLEILKKYADEYHPEYIRIVPNCQATMEQQEANNERLSAMVEAIGAPFFYQAKHFSTPEKCYWGYLKPFVLHNGMVYPCSSVVLNEDSEKTFHSRYQWVSMEDLPNMYKHPMKGGNWGCSHCVFRTQNDLIASLRNPTGMENFV